MNRLIFRVTRSHGFRVGNPVDIVYASISIEDATKVAVRTTNSFKVGEIPGTRNSDVINYVVVDDGRQMDAWPWNT
jgi:hypothetical protein